MIAVVIVHAFIVVKSVRSMVIKNFHAKPFGVILLHLCTRPVYARSSQ